MIINNNLKLKNMEAHTILGAFVLITKNLTEEQQHETIKLVEKFEELNARTFVAFWDKLHYTNNEDVVQVKTMDFFTNEINGYHAEDVEQIQALKIGEVWSLDKGQFITRVR